MHEDEEGSENNMLSAFSLDTFTNNLIKQLTHEPRVENPMKYLEQARHVENISGGKYG